jgi:peptide/nickel transport system ATP-binding protein
MSPPLLSVSGLSKRFPVGADMLGRPRAWLSAVKEVSFALAEGETLGFVGESGCGKTTLGRMILRLIEPTGGRIEFAGQDITHMSESDLRPLRRQIQVVFQDPFSSLNPRLRVRDVIGEPLKNFGFARSEVDARVAELMRVVGLPPEYMSRYPHAFSGGQRQRIGIARALALNPKLIVCDEAVSALDVSIQAQILNLLDDIQREFGLTLLFISHNLAVVRHVSHRIAVMYLGELVELAPEPALFERPLHPYTKALIDAVPEPDPEQRNQQAALEGEIPSPLNPPPGCTFHTRCPKAAERCRREAPQFRRIEAERQVRCHFPG